MVGAILILFIKNNRLVKWVALSTTVLTFIVSLPIYKNFDKSTYEMQFVEIHPWVPAWNIDYKVGVDGISVRQIRHRFTVVQCQSCGGTEFDCGTPSRFGE